MAQERRGPPQRKNLPHFRRDGDPAFRGHLLIEDGLGEDGQKVGGRRGFFRAGMERRGEGRGEIGEDVVPVRGDFLGRKGEVGGDHERSPVQRKGRGWLISGDDTRKSRLRKNTRPPLPRRNHRVTEAPRTHREIPSEELFSVRSLRLGVSVVNDPANRGGSRLLAAFGHSRRGGVGAG